MAIMLSSKKQYFSEYGQEERTAVGTQGHRKIKMFLLLMAENWEASSWPCVVINESICFLVSH